METIDTKEIAPLAGTNEAKADQLKTITGKPGQRMQGASLTP